MNQIDQLSHACFMYTALMFLHCLAAALFEASSQYQRLSCDPHGCYPSNGCSCTHGNTSTAGECAVISMMIIVVDVDALSCRGDYCGYCWANRTMMYLKRTSSLFPSLSRLQV